ncbi:hypothetical protein FC89_GL000304 [Liquorilactobacillus ghanensis DSM 18630]|uniref:DNA polymerase III beta sliding clamp C-terminal domain-containing protein n=1 Tax=Liquorilactobacillus ghanensis DSM 18630 TaxID=1423750 RepID=A0A0R1VVF9_9LACO|nr:hypothetical protein [Liquorilactobacillus ghanensis]KRM06995.1 hypothetical protein FC89_GL000304 [Liquorilactobacillus ghanensis DSM 18630]
MRLNTGIEKGLKNVIKNVGEARPILQCAHFENGNVVATDSHQLIRFRNIAPKDLSFNLNLTNFYFDDGNYPEIDELIPTKFATKFEININKAVELIPLLKSLPNDFINCTKMSVDNSKMILENEVLDSTNINQKLNVDIENFSGEEMSIKFNSKWLVNALESIKEIKKFGNVEFKLQESMLKPFLLVYENLDYLITPMRTFRG